MSKFIDFQNILRVKSEQLCEAILKQHYFQHVSLLIICSQDNANMLMLSR